MHVSSDLLTERAENFELDDSPAQPGIKKSHCWQVSDCDVVFSSLSNALPQRICYKVGDWVVVIYDNVEYPGKIILIYCRNILYKIEILMECLIGQSQQITSSTMAKIFPEKFQHRKPLNNRVFPFWTFHNLL